ncbi:DUF4114 domain-containing protein [Winogradskyella marincola]|uniref:DUF4114 domain-containing protein n=1 Tax=Winogradskyella marincola TaxID=3037795 RepID=A0ABT6G1I2_9FLAO|nr:DUF4114 domain-containing protein [Winogradskyella sp. YYF002]MDG4715901.1 DUF4114 domain-containing protein [Winogradskyella sp. YYF002]
MKHKLLLICSILTLAVSAQNYQFLGEYTSDGTPLYLENPGDTVSNETIEMINNSLPEGYPVPDYNPHYISSGYDTDLQIDSLADVWVTFVSEGAGYKNVLGYYTYDLNNPSPSVPQPEDITIIFPNASALYSGGGLQVGDKVKIGTFPEGTGIGWVLLANAWDSSSSTVGYGHWQLYSNPDYNPEAEETLRYHNVLLNDPDNERIILGFEDIRRDYGSCDNDFNDAIFYITANPYTALRTVNYADVNSSADVTSGNDGGLESNGDLASLIAKRNFNRTKNNQIKNKRSLQTKFRKQEYIQQKSFNSGSNIESYLPETGMYGDETAFVSSPEDLIGITNATEVFSLDMYKEDTRVSAVLATATEGAVYDHSKVICDRLNSSSLEDIRTVRVREHQVISAKILRSTGEIEYTLSFSIKLGEAQNELFSFWNIEQYPEGDYYNFQIWGSSFSQVFSIGNHIIDTLTAEKALVSAQQDDVIPMVFVKSGSYSNGELQLDIINKVNATALNFNGSIAPTETTEHYSDLQTVPLSGEWNEQIAITTGTLFDVGFSLQVDGYSQQDALYLADGPWGIDYNTHLEQIASFTVDNNPIAYDDDLYEIERQPTISGVVTGNVNLFRHVLPGDQTLDVTDFEAIQFYMTTDNPIEVILMPEQLDDWNNRLRYTIPANTANTFYNIAFSDFVDANGESGDVTNVKTIVFSVLGDYSNSVPFNLGVSEVAFGAQQSLGINDFETEDNTLQAFPNPMTSHTTVNFTMAQNETVQFVVYNQLGKQVYNKTHNAVAGKNSITINRNNLSAGVYFCKIIHSQIEINPLKLIVK